MTKEYPTREQWLIAAIDLLAREFFNEGIDLPEKLSISCGFPHGQGSGKAIGQCWSPMVAAEGTTHMFISPKLIDNVEVIQVTLHEMIHAAVGLECGHRGAFRKMAKSFGMAGKMTATFAEAGSELEQRLIVISDRLGAYPHDPMNPQTGRKKDRKRGWIRLKSINDPKFTVQISEKTIEELGFPFDPWGDEMVKKEVAE